MATECRLPTMLSKLSKKRKPEDDVKVAQGKPKRAKQSHEYQYTADEAAQAIKRLDKVAANWYSNLDKWQTWHDPGLESNFRVLKDVGIERRATRICVKSDKNFIKHK